MKKQQFCHRMPSVIRHSIILLLAFVLSLALTTKANSSVGLPSCGVQPSTPLVTQPTDANPKALRVTTKIKSISSDQSAMQIQCLQAGDLSTITIAVKDSELKAALKSYGRGDQVDIGYSQKDGLQKLAVATHEVEWTTRIGTIFIVFIALLLIFWFLLRDGLWKLILGEDNRFSNSKTQIVLWFFILMVTYLASIVVRGRYGGIDFVGGVSIPQNLLVLSGLSAVTFVTAKGINQSKFPPGQEKEKAKEPKFPDDLFLDDERRVDLGDFQMIIITLIAVVVYFLEVLGFLGTIELHKTVKLPDVDTTILATFGLGQGAYLVKKYIGDSGGGNPVTLPTSNPNTTPDPNAGSRTPNT